MSGLEIFGFKNAPEKPNLIQTQAEYAISIFKMKTENYFEVCSMNMNSKLRLKKDTIDQSLEEEHLIGKALRQVEVKISQPHIDLSAAAEDDTESSTASSDETTKTAHHSQVQQVASDVDLTTTYNLPRILKHSFSAHFLSTTEEKALMLISVFYNEDKNSENVLNDFQDWTDTMRIVDFTKNLLNFTENRSDLPRNIRDAAIILTPIDIMERRVRSQHPPPNSLDELRQSLIRVWEDIPQETIRSLIESMPRQCQATITSRGPNTSY
ncbi:hypothetical protein ILUMI_04524 [Ignelater luminosus]|uniref:Uncharacterized protein n=1 Tax=Ignelater luminosus TaxID=2038154 RepID=A0A8K0D9I5_IGNLU|nr:hypothetical protein ILUMI_04524 [Ignelater luminosus]